MCLDYSAYSFPNKYLFIGNFVFVFIFIIIILFLTKFLLNNINLEIKESNNCTIVTEM